MSYFGNNFLLSNSANLTNDGSYKAIFQTLRLSSLSPNSIVGTDNNRNLVSVPPNVQTYASLSIPFEWTVSHVEAPMSINSNSSGVISFTTQDSLNNINVNTSQYQSTTFYNSLIIKDSGDYKIEGSLCVSGSPNQLIVLSIVSTLNTTTTQIAGTLFSANSNNPCLTRVMNLPAGSNISLHYNALAVASNPLGGQCNNSSKTNVWCANLNLVLLKTT